MIALTHEEELNLIELMEMNNISISIDATSLLNFGYQFLTDKAKLTYTYMNSIATHNEATTGKPTCFVSLEYLSVVYNCSLKTQRNIINNLSDCCLITKKVDHFIVHDPVAETTFKETIYKLIYRKEIVSTLSYIDTSINPSSRHNHIKKLYELEKEQKNVPYLTPIFESYENRIKLIILDSSI